ncbi:MAG: metalloregulator ArsR/SmtB family transcription factor [Desulfatiglans sp.]|jgi:DNA-binding HxlR family transcriptional regulator|nr:metalloregulator ArsR/SmtB family transcription factor [Thermodesulfobacteriota bacterium]MEE4354809.1 metalloregulator ArsR/SmtB family transcription factor [Desulfatiglans sp.]
MDSPEQRNKNKGTLPLILERAPEDGICCSTDECANMMRVLGDTNRLQIIRSLIAGPKNVSQISEATHLHPQRVSHHLSPMRLAGLVLGERHGRNIIYRISPKIACEQGLDLGCCSIVFRAF